MLFFLILGYYAQIPVWFSGDEAQANNEQFLHLLWCSDHSPRAKDSLASRNLVTIIPSSRYVFDGDGTINSTVQIALPHIVQSFNQLSSQGAVLRDPISNEIVPELWLSGVLFDFFWLLRC